MMRSWFKYLVYVSLVFLVITLYQANYLEIPPIYSLPLFIASFLFLFVESFTSAAAWKLILQKSYYAVNLYACLAGTGLSVFGKYIPGKIWLVVGRAAYLSEKYHYSLGKLSAISLDAQLIALWLGLIFGTVGLFTLGGLYLWGWFILILWLALTAVIFSKIAHNSVKGFIRFISRKEILIPHLNVRSTISVLPWFAVNWMLISIGFYSLVASLTPIKVPWSVGLGFPLAATLGMMALIVPGGLGAREGVMVGYLTLAGFPLVEATTIAVASRLWFLVGEVFIFIVGWIADKHSGNTFDRLTHENYDTSIITK